MVTIAVTGERDGEPRVAVSPETVKKLTGLGCTVRVETGAGARSRFADSVLQAQGATIAASAAEALAGADILLKVRRPSPEEVKALKPGAIVAAMLTPYDDRAGLDALAATGVILGAVYMLWMCRRVIFGPLALAENQKLKDLSARELALLAPIVALIIIMGVYPQPFLSRMKPAVENTLKKVFIVQGAPVATTSSGDVEAK